MKFKIDRVWKEQGNLHVDISYEGCPRRSFGFPVEYSDLDKKTGNPKYLDEIIRVLSAEEKRKSKVSEKKLKEYEGKEVSINV